MTKDVLFFRLVNESLERVEKDQLAMAAAKMRKPTPTGSLALGSPPGLQPLIEEKEDGEEEEEGGETTSDPFDVSGRGPIYVHTLLVLFPDPQRDPAPVQLYTVLRVWEPN